MPFCDQAAAEGCRFPPTVRRRVPTSAAMCVLFVEDYAEGAAGVRRLTPFLLLVVLGMDPCLESEAKNTRHLLSVSTEFVVGNPQSCNTWTIYS